MRVLFFYCKLHTRQTDRLPLFISPPPAVQSLNSLNDQIANFMVTAPKSPELEEEPIFPPLEKENLQKSMTLMRHLLVDAQVHESVSSLTSSARHVNKQK